MFFLFTPSHFSISFRLSVVSGKQASREAHGSGASLCFVAENEWWWRCGSLRRKRHRGPWLAIRIIHFSGGFQPPSLPAAVTNARVCMTWL